MTVLRIVARSETGRHGHRIREQALAATQAAEVRSRVVEQDAHLIVALQEVRPGSLNVVLMDAEEPMRRFWASSTEWLETTATGTNPVVVRTLGEALDQWAREHLADWEAATQRSDWETSSEVLLLLLERLMQDQEVLIRALAKAWGDRDAALARIDVLESQLRALRAERLRVPEEKRRRDVIGSIALCVATVLGPIAGVVVDHSISDSVNSASAQAAVVVNDCNFSASLPRR